MNRKCTPVFFQLKDLSRGDVEKIVQILTFWFPHQKLVFFFVFRASKPVKSEKMAPKPAKPPLSANKNEVVRTAATWGLILQEDILDFVEFSCVITQVNRRVDHFVSLMIERRSVDKPFK